MNETAAGHSCRRWSVGFICIKINTVFELQDDNHLDSFETKQFNTIYYDGFILGSILNEQSHTAYETFQLLANTKSVEEFVHIIRYCIGNIRFFIKEKNEWILITSPNSYPVYQYCMEDGICFSTNESEIASLAVKNNEQINPFELFDLILLHRKELTAYGSLFQHMHKTPCGHVLRINRLFESQWENYQCQSLKQRDHSYKTFKQLFEQVAKIYASSKKHLFLFLGGIDSVTIYLALKQYTDHITPISYCQEGNGYDDKGYVRELTQTYQETIGIPVQLYQPDRYEKTLRHLRDHACQLNSSNCARWDSYLYYGALDFYHPDEDTMFISGAPFDLVYGVEYTKNLPGDPRGMIGRYFYSWMYQRNMQSYLNTRLRQWYTNDSFSPYYQYLYALCYPFEYTNHKLPLLMLQDVYGDDGFKKSYQIYKEHMLLSAVNPSLESSNATKDKAINQFFRILRHLQSSGLHYRNYAGLHTLGLTMMSYPSEGPLLQYFIGYQLGLRDICFPKRFLHKYFREHTGYSFTTLMLQANQSSKLSIPKRFISSLHTYDYSLIQQQKKNGRFFLRDISQSKDSFLFSKVFRDDFFSVVDLDDPYPLRFLSHPFAKKIIQEYYQDAQRGLLDYDEVMDIYNVELFLRHAAKEPRRNAV